jgi:hypothetical protein
LLVFASEFLNLWRSATLRRSKFGECVPSGPLRELRSTCSSGAWKIFFGP